MDSTSNSAIVVLLKGNKLSTFIVCIVYTPMIEYKYSQEIINDCKYMNLNSFYGLEKVRKDKNIFQTFTNKTEMNNHLLNIGLISLDEFRKREHGRLSHRELDNLIVNQAPY